MAFINTTIPRCKFLKLDEETLKNLKRSLGRLGPASRGKSHFYSKLSKNKQKILDNYYDFRETEIINKNFEAQTDQIVLNESRQKGKFPVTIHTGKKINKNNLIKLKSYEKRKKQKLQTKLRKYELEIKFNRNSEHY